MNNNNIVLTDQELASVNGGFLPLAVGIFGVAYTVGADYARKQRRNGH